MKSAKLILLLALLLKVEAQQTGSIQGKVTTIENVPIKGAFLELSAVIGGRVRSYTAETGKDGLFQFRNISPASDYQLIAAYPSDPISAPYLPAQYGQPAPGLPGTPIQLASGQKIENLRLTLAPTAEVTGRVVMPDGKPFDSSASSKGRILAVQASYEDGRRVLAQALNQRDGVPGQAYSIRTMATGVDGLESLTGPAMANPGMSGRSNIVRVDGADRDGAFRITGLPPGRYYFSVSNFTNPAVGFTHGYCPGLAESENATPVQIGIGAHVDLGTCVLPPIRKRYKVRTRAAPDSSASSVEATFVVARPYADPGAYADDYDSLVFRGPLQMGIILNGASSPDAVPTAEFAAARTQKAQSPEFPLFSGSYVVRASATVNGRRLFGVRPFVVADSDISDLPVTLLPGSTVSGQLPLEDGASAFRVLGRTSIRLRPLMVGFPEPPPAGLSTSGTFSFKDVPPGDYRVDVSVSKAAYIESIRFGALDVLNKPLHVEPATEVNLDVSIKTNGALIQGRVLGERSEPTGQIRVVLVPAMERRGNVDAFRNAVTDSAGRFELSGVAPGSYTLFAWQLVETGAWHDPDFIKDYEGRGRAITVNQFQQVNDLDIPFIPAWK